MAGCFGESDEDRWKESLGMEDDESEGFEIDEDVNHFCDWCQVKYDTTESNSREPNMYCSASCRSLHYELS